MKEKSDVDESPFFEMNEPVEIQTIHELFELNKEKTYGAPGKNFTSGSSLNDLASSYVSPHNTSGLFRGQAKNWPLIPTSYRGIKFDSNGNVSEIKAKYEYFRSTHQFQEFSEKASQQNATFPESIFKQMSIAQQYGIKTPLLDWTSNILVAVYFALDLKGNEDIEGKKIFPFIYHIIDERLLSSEPSKSIEIEKFNESVWIRPFPIDRRIERQFSSFTYHPHPILKPIKISVDTYKIAEDIFHELWDIMKGFGFSSSHFFPDYAGLAEKIKQNYML